jgi:NTE family protein
MASGALPPGFPPVEIDGEHYWDGGIVSNTPLQFVLDELLAEDLLIFQVDLFSARGPVPRNLSEAAEREKDIRFSSRTRLNTDANLAIHKARNALRDLLAALPKSMADDPNVLLLGRHAKEHAVSVVQLINRARTCAGSAKDYEFSRPTMLEHWASGLAEVRRTFVHRQELMRRPAEGGTRTFDIGAFD